MTVSGEKAPIRGKIRKVCSTARAPRVDPRWGQEGTVTGGGLVVPKILTLRGAAQLKYVRRRHAGTSQAEQAGVGWGRSLEDLGDALMARPLRATESV